MIRIRLKYIATAAALMSASALVYAQTDDTTFDVTATVENSCTITANPLAFGAVNVLGADIDDTTTLSVTCTEGAAYDIGLNGGGAADTSNRVMPGTGAETETLSYALFQEEARTTNWGNIEGTDTTFSTGNGVEQVHTVYGRIPGGQTTVAAGSYSDTVTATVYY